MYSELCQKLNAQCPSFNDGKINFRTILLNKCQVLRSLSLSLVCCRSLRSFSSSSCSSFSAEFLKRFSQSLNNSQQEAFEERIPKEKYNIDEEKLQKERRKAIGNVIFIGELFQVNLIAIKRVLLCIGDLIRQLDANLKQTSPNVFIFCLDKISMISLSSVLIFVVFFSLS